MASERASDEERFRSLARCEFSTASEASRAVRNRSSSRSARSFTVSGLATDAAMALDFLHALRPPLLPATLERLEAVLPTSNVGLSVLAALKTKELGTLLGVSNVVELARIKTSLSHDASERYAPPPLGPNGEPVVVRPKIGFTAMNQVDTVNQTVHVRFYLDLYWNDPRVAGLGYVPDGVWRPADCYVINQHGEMDRIRHGDNPVLIDSTTGLLLWPVELVGELQNPMKLHAFPFDCDDISIHVHQNETSSRDDYLLRPFTDAAEEQQSVRFFFGVFEDLTEFDVVGFSKECYENVGGNQIEYSNLKLTIHVVRRWQYYAWKVAFPMLLCTIFCFVALFLPIDAEGQASEGIFSSQVDKEALSERTNVAATMFLASSALLYVVASTLPKTAYLTTMDKYVLVNMLIQFSVAVVSWLSVGVIFPMTNHAAIRVNQVAFWLLLGLVFLSSALILGVPMVRAAWRDRKSWPTTLSREEPTTAFYPFELFVNVFPPWQPGGKNPVKLAEKTYGLANTRSALQVEQTRPSEDRRSAKEGLLSSSPAM